MNVLTINSSDYVIGGAAKISFDLHDANRIADSSSRVFVGKKTTSRDDVHEIPRSFFRKAASYLFSNDIDLFSTDYILETDEFKSADIVHCHNLSGWYFNLATLIKMSKIKPLVWTLHDMWSVTPHSAHTDSIEMTNGLYKCSNHKLYPMMLWNNDRYLSWRKSHLYQQGSFSIVAPCDWLNNKLQKSCLNDKRINVIYNGVDTDIFCPKLTNKTNRLKHKRILFLGAAAIHNPFKGFSDFLYVSDFFDKSRFEFICVGATSDGQVGNVRLIQGTDDKNEIAEYIRGVDLLVLPSYHEVFPLVVLEALACGVPVVAYDVGGVSEVIKELPACALVPRGDKQKLIGAINSSIEESAKIKDLKNILSGVVRKNFSLQSMVSNYQELYKKVITNFLLTQRRMD